MSAPRGAGSPPPPTPTARTAATPAGTGKHPPPTRSCGLDRVGTLGGIRRPASWPARTGPAAAPRHRTAPEPQPVARRRPGPVPDPARPARPAAAARPGRRRPGPGCAAFRRGHPGDCGAADRGRHLAGADQPGGPGPAAGPVTVPRAGRRDGARRVVLYPPAARRDPAGPAPGHFRGRHSACPSAGKASRPRPPPRRRTPAKQPPATHVQCTIRATTQNAHETRWIAPGAQLPGPQSVATLQVTQPGSERKRHETRAGKRVSEWRTTRR